MIVFSSLNLFQTDWELIYQLRSLKEFHGYTHTQVKYIT